MSEKPIAKLIIRNAAELHPDTVDQLIEWLEGQKQTLKNERKELSEQYTSAFWINNHKIGAMSAAILNAI